MSTLPTTPEPAAPSPSGPEPFASYLAKCFARGGYVRGTVPEARALLSASDHVLTSSDGMSFSVVCIVDAESDPSRRFALDRSQLLEIGKACRAKYCGSINHAKMPAIIDVVEVRRPATEADTRRLKPLRSRVGIVVGSFLVDLSKKEVTTNYGLGRFHGRARQITRALRAPRVNETQLAQVPAALPKGARQPWLTYVMLGVLAAVFVVEQLFPVAATSGFLEPHVQTLIAMGGLHRKLVFDAGEWHRLLTSALLHANPLHLVLNGFSFWIAGIALESLVGRVWFFALFVLGALGGSSLSLLLNSPDTVSVGASGAIMCLLAAAFVSSFRLPGGVERTQLHSMLLRILIPSLIPLATMHTGDKIDFAGHLGGALAGFALGGLPLATWQRSSPHPRFAGLARTLAVLGLGLLIWSGARAATSYSAYATAAQLVPDDQLPKDPIEFGNQAAELLQRYPRDPRVHLYRALALLKSGDAKGGEEQLRAALAEPEILHTHFSRELEVLIRNMLASTLLDQGRQAEASEAAKPVCAAGPGGSVPEELKKLGLCSP